MKNRVNILTILCCIALLVSCSKMAPGSGNSTENGVVTIQLDMPSTGAKAGSTDQGTPAENYIGMTQVVFFTPTDNKSGVVERIITFDAAESSNDGQSAWDATAKKLSVKGINDSEPKGVCVVANATAANGYDVTAIKVGETTEADLLKFITKSTTLPNHPTMEKGILMSYFVEKHDFSIAYILTVPLRRQLVKINLIVKLDQTFAGHFPATSFWDTDLKDNRFVNTYNIQDRSFVHIATPVSAPTSSELFDVMSIKDISQIGDGKLTEWHLTIYTYENPQAGKSPEDKNTSTWFVLNLPYKDGGVVFDKNYYKFYINDKLDSDNPHKTLRNHIYDLTATVNGFGGLTPDDGRSVDDITTVRKWSTVTMNDEVGEFVMTTNKASVVLSGHTLDQSLIARGTSNLDESLFADLFSEITYTDSTMTDAQKNLKLGYVHGPDSNSLTITVQDLAEVPYKGSGVATFDIKYGSFKKKITINYFLPLPSIIGFFGGDPDMTKLAGTGELYPSRLAVATSEAWYIQYKKSDTANDFLINSIYYGRNMNMAAAALPNLADYPAFAYCASLNKDMDGNGSVDDYEQIWYVPARNQFQAIYVFAGGLDYPLQEKIENYWSATQSADRSAWIVTSIGHTLEFALKTTGNSIVRCVRDI